MASLKRDVVSGLVVLAPIVVTLIAISFVFQFLAGLPGLGRYPVYLRVPIVILVFVTVVLAIGYLMRTALGIYLVDLLTATINRIPVVRVAYNASHLAVETMLRGAKGQVEVVQLESWKGLRVTAFSTGIRTDDGRLICFFPTAPNITTGYVVEVEEEDIRRTDERVEEALTRLISAGFGDSTREDPPPVRGGRTVGRVNNVELPRDRD